MFGDPYSGKSGEEFLFQEVISRRVSFCVFDDLLSLLSVNKVGDVCRNEYAVHFERVSNLTPEVRYFTDSDSRSQN
jgi:hypothetical protein